MAIKNPAVNMRIKYSSSYIAQIGAKGTKFETELKGMRGKIVEVCAKVGNDVRVKIQFDDETEELGPRGCLCNNLDLVK